MKFTMHEEGTRDGREAALIMTALNALPRSSKRDKAMNLLFNPGMQVTEIVPGVIDLNNAGQWIYDEINAGNDIGLTEHLKECEDYKKTGDCMCELDFGEILIGDWKRSWEWYWPSTGKVAPIRGQRDRHEKYDSDLLYTEVAKRRKIWVKDKTGKDGYAAIYNKGSYTIQVVWSKWVNTDARWCSPCYPGQASLNTRGGEVMCYMLPPELMRCMECEDSEREVVHAVDEKGMMLCEVCCKKFGIDYQTGERKES